MGEAQRHGSDWPCRCQKTRGRLMCACPFTIWAADDWKGDRERLVCNWCADGTHAFID